MFFFSSYDITYTVIILEYELSSMGFYFYFRFAMLDFRFALLDWSVAFFLFSPKLASLAFFVNELSSWVFSSTFGLQCSTFGLHTFYFPFAMLDFRFARDQGQGPGTGTKDRDQKPDILLKRSARKFCIFSILNHRKLICFRSSYDIFCFFFLL